MSEDQSSPDGTLQFARGRAFRISDAMALIAGSALVLAAGSHLLGPWADTLGRLFRQALAHRDELPNHWPLFWDATHEPLRNTLWYGFQLAESLIFVMTPVFFYLRLRRPRPPLRDLLRQPGVVAGLAMVFGLFWGTGALLVLFPEKVDAMTAAPTAVGVAVAVAWGVLALSGRWRAEAGWVDRMGRLLGWAAIGTALLGILVFRI
jgi:hypothetical protein